MDAAVYLRISYDPSGQALGVARQREDCTALCTSKGWTSVEYIDNDTSASTGKRRPAYERMLADIRDGRIGAVVAWDLDRLHRRPIELESFMALADERHLALATVSGDVDLSTAQGRLVARMKGSVAAHEIEHKKARQRRAAEQKAARGEPQWKRAFGYLDEARTPDPTTAPLVKQAYAAVLAGSSLADICALFNDAGALTARWVRPRDADGSPVRDAKPILERRPWNPSLVSQFLRKPRNAGLRDHNGTIVGRGTWPPLVDEETWRAAQSVLDAPGRSPGRKTVRRHLLTGVLRCGRAGCGGHLSGMQTIDKRITYACKTCRGVSIRAEHVEPMIYHAVGERLAQPDAVDLLKAELHDTAEAERLRGERATLLARLDEIAVERADGLIDGKGYRTMTDRINAQLVSLERAQQDQERLRVFDGLPLGTPEVVERVRALSPDRLRAVIDVLVVFEVAPVGKGGHVFNPDRVTATWK
jgi:DNA invertase Pin-like site-specific DNA recombinase